MKTSWPSSLFRQLAEVAVVGLYVLEGDRFYYVNQTLADMLGYSRNEMLESLSLFDVVFQDDHETVRQRLSQSYGANAGSIRYERRALRKDGTPLPVEIYGVKITLDNRDFLMGVMLDITRRQKAEETAELTSLVYEHSSEAMVITNPDGCIITVNPAFTKITGYKANEVSGQRMSLLSSGRHDKAFYQRMWASIIETGRWRGEIWNRRKNGQEYAEYLTINTSFNDDGTPRYHIGLFSDITKKKIRNEKIWHQANFDYLTGLPNRKRFHETLIAKTSGDPNHNQPLALIYLDLDDFKDINDALGHATGDIMLRLVAERLQRCVRRSDTVARLGGDEFGFILNGTNNREHVSRICEKIIETLSQPFKLGEHTGTISASIGVAFYPKDATEANELLNNADLAMYASKDYGAGNHRYYTPKISAHAAQRHQLLRDIAQAVSKDQLHLCYQPIFDLKNQRLLKAEALIQWQHPERGLINPDEFIPVAESSGLIVQIGEWVFQNAIKQLSFWSLKYSNEFGLAINVSPAQLHHPDFHPEKWLETLKDMQVCASQVVIEITESLLIDATPGVIQKLKTFRDAGVGVALDDFGTGYSYLPYLKHLDIDYIKIDRSFIKNLAYNDDDYAICDAIILMAHRLGLRVIGEGVECPVQLQRLQQIGCDAAQGYLCSKPLPANEFEQILEQSFMHL